MTASEAIRERLRATEATGTRTFADPEPLVWASTSGTTITDEDGRDYLDLYAGFAAATLGYCHPRVTEAIVRQAATMTHCPSAAPSRVRAELEERLVAIAPPGLTRVLPAMSGAMANEWAIQLARHATGRRGVISFSGTYLGRSVGTVALRRQAAPTGPASGPPTDAQFLPFPDPYRSRRGRAAATPGALVLGLLEELLADPASGVEAPACIVDRADPGQRRRA